ncbi:hypothetical protein BU26DRAFT_522281 [Trematosphaeria pertusa]|uniref:Uncharacterized protein n=1 Tax=Trematosphaeria pertusa TaxID=390896 RepID=A0A6A6I5E0_9PLEO|nr:uncharacterized protein BU26DRAFT_522281 [Trematosphaeria pertusa]KAF2245172.1 hypothetical protein BU26DRAFT_522281 [Trematosphaeria pertusa]
MADAEGGHSSGEYGDAVVETAILANPKDLAVVDSSGKRAQAKRREKREKKEKEAREKEQREESK